jgi:dTDP-glucose 4,6-dehydratase
MNLLITGGCGFIASNFINYYFDKNKDKLNKLINLDAMYYCADEKNVNQKIRGDEKYKLIKGNCVNIDLVTNILDQYNITHVIHFAAQSHVQNSFEDSLQYTQDNIVGTHVLLECCRKYGKIERFIHVSTDEVYGESMISVDEKHKTEHSVLCPTNPYAATKAGAELIAQSYNHSFGMPIIITRGNNVYGPNQYPEKLIPKFIKLLKEDKKVTIQGDGSCVRAFLHAYDTATAFECILEKGKIGEIYNIGCDEGMEYSVIEVTKILIEMIKKTKDYDQWITYIEDRPFNDQRYYISNQKLKDLGWNITVDFINGIKQLIINNTKIIFKPNKILIYKDFSFENNFYLHQYDFIIPFGIRCSNGIALKEIGYREYSFPIDFIGIKLMYKLINCFNDDFKHFTTRINNTNENFYEMPMTHFPNFDSSEKEKIELRIKRFYKALKNYKVLLVCSNEDYFYNKKYRGEYCNTLYNDMISLSDILDKKFNNPNIDILLIDGEEHKNIKNIYCCKMNIKKERTKKTKIEIYTMYRHFLGTVIKSITCKPKNPKLIDI